MNRTDTVGLAKKLNSRYCTISDCGLKLVLTLAIQPLLLSVDIDNVFTESAHWADSV